MIINFLQNELKFFPLHVVAGLVKANSNIVTTLTQKIDLPNGDYAARGAMSMEISFSPQFYRFISTMHFFSMELMRHFKP